MRILMFGMDVTNYGSPSLEIRVGNYLAHLGHPTCLFVEREPKFDKDEKSDNFEVNVLPVASFSLGRTELTSDQISLILSKGKDCDVIYGSSITSVMLTIYFAEKLNLPVVSLVHDVPSWRFAFKEYVEQWKRWLGLLAKSTKTIAVTEATKNTLKRFIPTLDVEVIYYGIDHVTADSVPEPKQEDCMCSVSRHVWYKALELLFYTIKKFNLSYPLKLIGGGPETRRYIETASYCRAQAVFLGPVSDKEKFKTIKASRFGVYPDICEYISGLFPLESLYCKRPCIVWDTPVNRERFQNAVEYVPIFDLESLGEKISFMIENPDYCRKRGKEGRKFVAENRTYKQLSNGLLRVMEECLRA